MKQNIKIPEDKTCWDCHCKIKINSKGNIENGKLLKYKENDEEYIVFKCDKCFKEDPSLRNFRESEVYSRVVGYLRPIKQWNKGKQEEFKNRVEFKKI